MVDRAIVTAVRRYLSAVSSEGIHARRAVLFGSLARGEADEWSDIDLIVIAPEFDGPRDVAQVEALWRAILVADNRIEPIPCGEREWETDETRPILEIARREGIVIADRGLGDDNDRP
jgi:predicted nucleotidyltransferase